MNDRPNPGWFGRNWKWLVPTGCLTVLLLFALVLAGLIGLGVKGVSGLMSGSEPVRHALALAKAHPEVQAAFGEPLETGMGFQGSLTTHNDSGSADLSVPIKGPKGSGRLYVKGEREADRWTYRLIEIAVDGSERRIDLLGSPAQSAPKEVAPQETVPEKTEERDPDAPAEPAAAA
ncbi:cytochrome c oxidase assembly factor Coa1 family protein [Lysobacter enzymogenes]|uniref:cytochrome c oxidase assembly factor Coa1 family protein n=1 Tax=Lysobacter enzymogenes TaxID=69 RepID=UPI00384F3933